MKTFLAGERLPLPEPHNSQKHEEPARRAQAMQTHHAESRLPSGRSTQDATLLCARHPRASCLAPGAHSWSPKATRTGQTANPKGSPCSASPFPWETPTKVVPRCSRAPACCPPTTLGLPHPKTRVAETARRSRKRKTFYAERAGMHEDTFAIYRVLPLATDSRTGLSRLPDPGPSTSTRAAWVPRMHS